MSDEQQGPYADAPSRRVLLERQLDERWEMVSPGIYRLRENAAPEPTDMPEPPGSESTRVDAIFDRSMVDELVKSVGKRKRRGLKRPKHKHR